MSNVPNRDYRLPNCLILRISTMPFPSRGVRRPPQSSLEFHSFPLMSVSQRGSATVRRKRQIRFHGQFGRAKGRKLSHRRQAIGELFVANCVQRRGDRPLGRDGFLRTRLELLVPRSPPASGCCFLHGHSTTDRSTWTSHTGGAHKAPMYLVNWIMQWIPCLKADNPPAAVPVLPLYLLVLVSPPVLSPIWEYSGIF